LRRGGVIARHLAVAENERTNRFMQEVCKVNWSEIIVGGTLGVLFALFLWPEHGLYFRWKHRRRVGSRETIEDALIHIHQRENEGRPASIESLAGALDISTRQALSVVRKMEGQSLLTAKGEGLHLSAKGRHWALQVVRAHRLFERYLADETSLPIEKLHEQAGRLEHTLTPEEVDKLDADMGYPAFDPHGDPIPTASGELPVIESKSLVEWRTEHPAQIVHIEDEPPEVFAQIVAEGLKPGMTVTVVESSPTRIVFVSDENEHVLAPVIAANIAVRQAPAKAVALPFRRLSALKLGEKGRVLSLDDACRGLTRRRFLDMGITSGVHIEPVMQSIFGEPTAYRVRDTLIALRREQADLILVENDGGAQ